MRFRILCIILGTIAAVASIVSLFAGSTVGSNIAPQPLQPRVLIVFKNGLSWIEHRGEVALSNRWGVIPTTPEAVLGTVSLTSSEAKVDEVRTAGGLHTVERSGDTLQAMLARGAGKMVTLRVGDRDVSGRLVAWPKQQSSDAVLLEAGGKTTAIQRALITAVTFDGDVPAGEDDITPSLRFHVANRAGSAPMRLSYVRSGFGWFPDYSIILDGKGRAALTMRATLVDDGEDLRDTDVFFAVGVPHFAFGHAESPLSARQSLAELFSTLGQSTYEAASALANTFNLNVGTSRSGSERSAGFDAMTTAGTEGERADDFFYYSRKGITLAKGERAAFPLLEASVRYSDLYTLDISRTQNDVYGDQSESPLAGKVWHSIRLQNPTEFPWTTAPALVFAEGRPVAQETLRYTPSHGDTTMRLTVANNVVAGRSESELRRESVKRFGYAWDAVTVEGTIEIRNFKNETVVLAITREIEGEAIPAKGHRITRIAATPRAVNPIECLEWEISLRAGEQRTIKYQYKVFVKA
jgi:hypothetical protein